MNSESERAAFESLKGAWQSMPPFDVFCAGWRAARASSANETGAEVAQWQSRLKDRSSPVVDHWVNISPDGAKTLMEKYTDVYEVRALYTAPRSPAMAAEAVAIPGGWRLVRVNEHFDALIAALDRAESKGYLPDSIREEWENFACDENAPQPAQADARVGLTDEQIETLAHRRAYRYRHGPDSIEFIFNRHCLLNFARALLNGADQS
ncbi:hypothetical protein [Burkholderia multivorans]|uniref:hypothetical protein n=1 Tax=Burkholderia multivorans TaxID=87883 RepID=UPI0009E0CB35|nr:hypothetical protein UA21_01731 [Burkholderia multivorans]